MSVRMPAWSVTPMVTPKPNKASCRPHARSAMVAKKPAAKKPATKKPAAKAPAAKKAIAKPAATVRDLPFT